jgi:hypothetical protein
MEIARFVREDSFGTPFYGTGFRPLCWIGTALGVGGGLAASLFGGLAASDAAKAAERRQREQEAREEAWYNRRYNEDYLDTAAGQNLVRRAKDYAQSQWKRAAGAAAVTGASDASAQMAKDQGNKMIGDTIADIAATDTQRKAHVDDLHHQGQEKFAQMDIQRDMQRAENVTKAAGAASNAMMAVGVAADQSRPKVPNLAGGGNNSKVMTPQDVHTAHTGDDSLQWPRENARMGG